MGFPDPQKLIEHARREANAGESFFEFRLDYLPAPEQGVAVIRKFLAAHPECSILATCRRHQNQGKFNGSVEDQLRILDAAFEAGARAVDVEIESAENASPARQGPAPALLSQLRWHAVARIHRPPHVAHSRRWL
jgi:3-dehydroquinate dehydratase/shikimate dehydrogenase